MWGGIREGEDEPDWKPFFFPGTVCMAGWRTWGDGAGGREWKAGSGRVFLYLTIEGRACEDESGVRPGLT